MSADVFTYSDAENAAGIAAEMAGDPRFTAWLDTHSDALSGWSGFIALALRTAPIVDETISADEWEIITWYEMLATVADVLFAYTGRFDDPAELRAALVPKLRAELTRLAAAIADPNDPRGWTVITAGGQVEAEHPPAPQPMDSDPNVCALCWNPIVDCADCGASRVWCACDASVDYHREHCTAL